MPMPLTPYLLMIVLGGPPSLPRLAAWGCTPDTDGDHVGLLCAGICHVPYKKGTPVDGICRKPVAVHQAPTPERGEQELRALCAKFRNPQPRCLHGSDP